MFVQTSERCSLQTLPTLWWRMAAGPGSCLLLHQSHSCAETPAAPGAETPPPAADSYRLRNSPLHSGASAANNTDEQQLHNQDSRSTLLPVSVWSQAHKYLSIRRSACSTGYPIMLGKWEHLPMMWLWSIRTYVSAGFVNKAKQQTRHS